MIKGGKGGGNTQTGLIFEGKTDLSTFLGKQVGYSVIEGKVYYKDTQVGRIFKKHAFYSFLKEIGIEWEKLFLNDYSPMIAYM